MPVSYLEVIFEVSARTQAFRAVVYRKLRVDDQRPEDLHLLLFGAGWEVEAVKHVDGAGLTFYL